MSEMAIFRQPTSFLLAGSAGDARAVDKLQVLILQNVIGCSLLKPAFFRMVRDKRTDEYQ